MRLYLVRHGRPDVAPGICYGSTDLAVSPQEHARVAAALTPLLPELAPVFSSPLRRCSELASRLALSLGSGNVIYDERLVEMHFGDWEMRAWDDIPRAHIDAWAGNVAAYQPGGGECVLQVAQRVRAFHDELVVRHTLIFRPAQKLSSPRRRGSRDGPTAMVKGAVSAFNKVKHIKSLANCIGASLDPRLRGDDSFSAIGTGKFSCDKVLAQNHESVVVVCHAGTIRLLSECQQQATPMEMALNAARTRHAIGYGELVIIDC
jgi:alpha-ribazole phosphatase